MKAKTILTIAITSIVAVGCAGSKISTPRILPPLTAPIKSIALAPNGGVLADAIGIELFNNGFQVMDSKEISTYMVRVNLNEIELMEPSNLSVLKTRGIDTVLVVKTAAGYDGKPQSASVRAVSTGSGELVAAVTWQNGHGGAQGSPADANMRKDIVGAAQQIGKALVVQLRR